MILDTPLHYIARNTRQCRHRNERRAFMRLTSPRHALFGVQLQRLQFHANLSRGLEPYYRVPSPSYSGEVSLQVLYNKR